MNKDDYNLRKKVNKFGILSTHVHLSIGPEARIKGLESPKDQLKSVFLIIVEGKTDKKFYNEIFNQSNSVVIDLTCGESASEQERKIKKLFGKTAVQTLFKRDHHIKNPDCHFVIQVQKNMALGLIDLDFDKYPSSNDIINYPNLYKPQQYLHIFTTETNDLETLLLHYGILDNLLSEIFKKRKNNSNLLFENFKEYVFLRIKHLNFVFRLVTKEYGMSWKHVNVLNLEDLCSFINTSDDTLFESLTALIFHHDSKNNNNLEKKEKIEKDIAFDLTPMGNLYTTADFTRQVFLKDKDLIFCQGHNTMTVLQCMDLLFLGHRISDKELFKKITEDCLSNHRFQKTQLYKSLRRWEDNRYPLKPSRMFTEKLYDLPQ